MKRASYFFLWQFFHMPQLRPERKGPHDYLVNRLIWGPKINHLTCMRKPSAGGILLLSEFKLPSFWAISKFEIYECKNSHENSPKHINSQLCVRSLGIVDDIVRGLLEISQRSFVSSITSCLKLAIYFELNPDCGVLFKDLSSLWLDSGRLLWDEELFPCRVFEGDGFCCDLMWLICQCYDEQLSQLST